MESRTKTTKKAKNMSLTQNIYQPSIAFHPGETLAEKLQELGMGPKEFALRAGKPEKTIIAVLKGKSAITSEMAITFEHVLKIPARIWLNLQRLYDEQVAREKRLEALTAASGWASRFPYSDMVKQGWIEPARNILDKTNALMDFFGLSSESAWENYYLNSQLKVSFRLSLSSAADPFALSAWLRKGEIEAEAISAPPYSEAAFRESLSLIRDLMVRHPADFFEELKQICLTSGVKLIFTPAIKNAAVNGCTRWMHDSPVIQLSGRYNRNDVFWFTFFHEAGHIILHGKKEIFLEIPEFTANHQAKEREADSFAMSHTFTVEEEESVLGDMPLSVSDIIRAAEKLRTHPAIILGRLQFRGHLPHHFGRELFQPVVLKPGLAEEDV